MPPSSDIVLASLTSCTQIIRHRLWEGLNFKKAGLIPQAGRLRRKDGNGEEYVDAWVFYKSFVDEDGVELTRS
ncbi:hypothetical protein B0H13DRAFT_1967257 [Mycena leptocephala]|nr:hypothetical protein B0H13DRAFT_1967257 [Mycena leptocephala]